MAGEAMSAFVRFFVKDEVSDKAKDVEKAAKDAADGMDEAAESAGSRLKNAFSDAGNSAADFGKKLAGVGAAGVALVGGVVGLSTATAETQEDLGKLETAFESVGHSSETAKSVLSDFTGLLGAENFDQAVEASNHLAELTSSTEELSTWGGIASGVYAKFGDSLPLEGLNITGHSRRNARLNVVNLSRVCGLCPC
jgi:phage-related protein